MRLAVLVALSLLAAPMAGCLGEQAAQDEAGPQQAVPPEDELSPKLYDVLPVEEVWVEATTDDKRIHNAVYRPDTNESVPVFINFSPYWGDSATEGGDAFAQHMIEEYVPRGYAVVLSAVRGTGHSEGCFQIGSDTELQDAHDVIDRFANADWANGNVLAGGKSYDSTTQNGVVAKRPHPDLVGIFHVSGITDVYRYTYRQGVAYSHGPIFNTYYYGQGIHEYGVGAPLGTGSPPGASSYENEDPGSLARLVDDAACTELPAMQAHGVGSGLHGMKTDYWVERDWNRYIADTAWNGSVFFVHGHQDWNVKPDHVLPWLQLLPEDVNVKGWLHQDVEQGPGGHVYPMRTDWNETMLRWMDHVAKGKKTGLEWGFESQGTDGLWRASEGWPPAGRDTINLTADDENVEVDADTASLRIQLPDEGQAVRLAGEPRVHVAATSTTSDPVLTAKLYEDLDDEDTWLNEGILRGIYRGGLEQPDPVVPDEVVNYELVFFPQDDVLEPGQQLELVLGQEPRYGVPAPGQLDAVNYDLQTVELVLPIAPAATGLDGQPEGTDCFAC